MLSTGSTVRVPWAVCVVLCVVVCVCAGQMSIPKREVGYVYNGGRPCASVKLEAYLDLSCPDSKQAYPVLLEVADYFGLENVQLKVHLFPLPYHRNSHVMSKGAHVIDQYKSAKNTTVFDWFKVIYANLDRLTPTATADKTDYQVLDILAPLAQGVCGISPDDFKKGVSDEAIDSATRLAWKYGCTRGVYGTPLFTVNDVFVQAQDDWTVAQWVALIKPLLL